MNAISVTMGRASRLRAAYSRLRQALPARVALACASAELIGTALRAVGYSVRTQMPPQISFEELQQPYREKLEAVARFWLLPAIVWPDETAVRAAADTVRSIVRKYGLAATLTLR